MKECTVKMEETRVSEIQIETKDEKGPVAVSPQEERQERKTATLCFKRRKKANKMKPKAGSETAEVTKKCPPEAGVSPQPQPAGAWASIKRFVTRRKRSESSKKPKLSEPEAQPEDAALPEKKAKSRLKIPCLRFSRGAKRSRHSKLTEDSGYVRVQGDADDLEIKAQTQLADQAIQAKSTQGLQEGVLAEDGKEGRESHGSNSVTSAEKVISVELELENKSSAIQMETETKVITEKPRVQAQQANLLESSEAAIPQPVASAAPPSPATIHWRGVEQPSASIQESAPSAKDERSRGNAAEEKKAEEIALSQAEEATVGQVKEATVIQAEETILSQAEKGKLSKAEEITVAQAEEATVSQAEEVIVGQAEKAIVSQLEEATAGQAEEATVSQTEEATVSQAEEATVGQVEEATVSQTEEATVSQAEEVTVAQAKEAAIGQVEEATVSQAEEAVVGQAKEATVSQVEAAIVSQAEETTAGQAEEATVSQTEEATASQAEEATAGQAEEAAIGQAEEGTAGQAEEATVSQVEEAAVSQVEAAMVSQAEEATVSQAEEATVSQAPDLKENGIDAEKPRSEESKRMEPIAIIITDTEISEFDVKKSKNVPKQFLVSMENEQVGVFANDGDFDGRTSEQYETLLIETASSLVKNAIELSVEQLVNEMVSGDDKINALVQ